ncbi:COP1-interacting protein 7-like isoform X2 [Juglans regia]|uniref:COP1-interacting protein 7-like isoform X2 n=1 Tax=Juglans regia TaxID=51240 RepID=A0A2I4DLL5_JUGRE|nr:COP1-interacting protein 7-like isoform X2 [Juglans regia]
MKSSTLLDSAVFQLTPTRTRCDLIISANGKEEKIASGLLNPFLAHLKTAQEQMDKGGYSIVLEPESTCDDSWFTKDTIERFVRFVSTPEVLERVYTLESEILQIEEAIVIQGNSDMGLNTVEDYQAKPVEITEGSRPVLDTDEEKAIVLYKPAVNPPEANGSTTQEGNSKVQLLKVLETRKTVLQKEQGMAFARAVAAGFDIDRMSPLLSFAGCFGASRLMDACTKFMELWRRKHETGQWVEVAATEAMSNQSDFSAMNTSGIMLANVDNKQKEYELVLENNGKASSATSADDKSPVDHKTPLGHQEYFQGQFPHHMFPPWPVHSPPGAPPVYQAYPMQGMPYYQNYPVNSPFFQPPYPSMPEHADPRMGHRRHSMDNRDGNTELETWQTDASKTRSQDGASQTRDSQKKASRSGKKQSGMVVIRNINYITSKRQNSSDGESQSASDSETDEEGGGLAASTLESKHMDSQRSSKRKGSHTKSMNKLKSSDEEELAHGKDVDGGHWQAFQSYLLRDADEDRRAVDQGMFAMEKEAQVKRRQNTLGDDPLVFSGQEKGETQEDSMIDMHKISGNVTYKPQALNDELLTSRRDGRSGYGRGSMDVQSAEIDGKRGGYRRTGNDDFLIHRRESQSGYTNSSSDPLVNGFDRVTNNLDRISSHEMDDDSYIVALRENSLDRIGNNERTAIDMDSEFQSASQLSENLSNRVGSQVNYEPDELSLIPERGRERESIGYDPALDYEMQIRAEDGAPIDNKNMEVDIKQGSKKSDKDRKSRLTPDNLDKKKTSGPIWKGKPSKLSPLDEARARAERLRAFKADLQKMKREKEEEEMKRLEALKIERQKRIAARGGSIAAKSPLMSHQTKKQLPTKVSPSSHKGSKLSNSEPGSSSSLKGSSIRTAPVGSSDSQEAFRPSRASAANHSDGNRLSHSVSSLPEPKKENSGVIADSKASMTRIRRLSEPKMVSSHHISSMKSRSAELVSKTKISDVPENKKASATTNHDRSKASSSTLPELNMRTSKGPDGSRSKSAAKEMTQKVNGIKSSITSESAEVKRKHENIAHHSDGDDNLVIEKTVLILECEKPSISTVEAMEGNLKAQKAQHDNFGTGKKVEVVSDYAVIHSPASPLKMDRIDGESSEHQSHEQHTSFEVTTVDADKEPPKLLSLGMAEKPYQAPFARVSSSEDPCTRNSEYGRAPPTSSEIVTTGTETVKALVSDSRNLRLENIPESLEKPQVKDSPKGFRRLLKFGRKNHSSATGEHNIESDNASVNGSEVDDSRLNFVSSSEVHTLKNLISQDETPTAGSTSQKTSRSFSLLSPFRGKTSEKKLTT